MSETRLFLSLFLTALPEHLRREVEQESKFESWLLSTVQTATASWPSLHLSLDGFVQHVAQCWIQAPSTKGWEDWFTHLQPCDLYLAYGCVEGNQSAIVLLEQTYARVFRRTVKRFSEHRFSEDDLMQVVREKLYLDTPKRLAKLRSYAGQGFLENWLRVTAVRACLDVVRVGTQQKREKPTLEEELLKLPDTEVDLELDYLKREYRGQFKEAFSLAIQSLSGRDRNFLRQHVVACLSIDQLAAIYHIHRSTAARRLERARRLLLEATRRELMQRLNISQHEFNSIMALIQSRLEASTIRLLQEDDSISKKDPS